MESNKKSENQVTPSDVPERKPPVRQPAFEAEDDEFGGGAAWLPKRPQSRLEQPGLDMTPMIDVTFQLLIFFMFANQLANPNPLEVPEARYGRGMTPDGKQMVLITENGGYYLGDVVDESLAVATVDDLAYEVEQNAGEANGPLDVIVAAHKNARHKFVRELAEKLGKIPNIGKVVLGVEEKQ